MKLLKPTFRGFELPCTTYEYSQVHDAFVKYIEKRTTSSIYQEVNPAGIRLPYLTICPSYNRPKDNGPLGKFPHFLADEESQNVTNGTEGEIEEYWLSKTFDARDGKFIVVL